MISLPDELLRSLNGLPGFDRGAFEAVHASGGQVTSIRVNPAKWKNEPAMERVPWSSWGYYLPERPSFTFDPLFHAGAYYVQEASGMFLEQAMRQGLRQALGQAAEPSGSARPLRVLDLCAAPGGKSTLLQSLLSPDSLLVANEVIRNRVTILEENMVKWGGGNVVVTSSDPEAFGRLENYFDVIVVDAPCSGSGLFRREPEAVREWSPDAVRLCHQRQQRILADCWPALRRDGLLIYSTCSYSREENEDIVDWMVSDLGGTTCPLSIASDWNIVETQGESGAFGYRFYPDRLRGEGLFMACVRKNGGGTPVALRNKSTSARVSKKDVERIAGWVESKQLLAYFHHGDVIHAMPENLIAEIPVLQSACYLKRAGVPIGKLSVKDLIPEHDLAVSTIVSGALPVMELSRGEALSYLRKDELALPPGQRGWMLVQYEGQNLGWIKALSGRINNYYPREWRILRREP